MLAHDGNGKNPILVNQKCFQNSKDMQKIFIGRVQMCALEGILEKVKQNSSRNESNKRACRFEQNVKKGTDWDFWMVAHDGTAQEETVIYEGKETKIELGIPFIFFCFQK